MYSFPLFLVNSPVVVPKSSLFTMEGKDALFVVENKLGGNGHDQFENVRFQVFSPLDCKTRLFDSFNGPAVDVLPEGPHRKGIE